VKESVLQNHGLWRKMHLSFVENNGHIGLALEVTEMGCALPVLVSQFRC
jgi:hypothetical protein